MASTCFFFLFHSDYNGQWKNQDGSDVDDAGVIWRDGSPDNSADDPNHCGWIGAGTVVDGPCSNKRNFVCKMGDTACAPECKKKLSQH